MICGIDVYHAGLGKVTHGSVAGFVASMDKGLTSWYSKICIQSRNQELIDLLKICLISAIRAYQQVIFYLKNLLLNSIFEKTYFTMFCLSEKRLFSRQNFYLS